MFIRTQRLFLRPAWREDAPALARLLSDAALQRDLQGAPWLESLADTDEIIAPPRSAQDVRLLIFRRTEDAPRLIGVAGLGRLFNRHEFALWLTRAEQRRGYAQEAGRALLSLAFDGLQVDTVWTPAFRDGAAGRLIARLGFRRPTADSAATVLRTSDWRVTTAQLAA